MTEKIRTAVTDWLTCPLTSYLEGRSSCDACDAVARDAAMLLVDLGYFGVVDSDLVGRLKASLRSLEGREGTAFVSSIKQICVGCRRLGDCLPGNTICNHRHDQVNPGKGEAGQNPGAMPADEW
jgi:hypothetical protein